MTWNALPRPVRALLATLAVGLFIAAVIAVQRLVYWLTSGSLWGFAGEMTVVTYVTAWNICRKDRP